MTFQEHALPGTKLKSYCDFKDHWKEHTTNPAPEHNATLLSKRFWQISAISSCPDFICMLSLSTQMMELERYTQHALGLVHSSVFYLFSCSFAYGFVFLQFRHLFSIQFDSFHDLLSLCHTKTQAYATPVTPHKPKHSSCPTGQAEGEAGGLTRSITGHLAQKGNLYSRLHHYSEHVNHVLKMSITTHVPPTAPGALCCSFNCLKLCYLDTELHPKQAVPLQSTSLEYFEWHKPF